MWFARSQCQLLNLEARRFCMRCGKYGVDNNVCVLHQYHTFSPQTASSATSLNLRRVYPCLAIRTAMLNLYMSLPSTCELQEFLAICAHLPTELKDDLKKVAALGEETHRLTAELSRDQAEIIEKAKLKCRQVHCCVPSLLALWCMRRLLSMTTGACVRFLGAQLLGYFIILYQLLGTFSKPVQPHSTFFRTWT